MNTHFCMDRGHSDGLIWDVTIILSVQENEIEWLLDIQQRAMYKRYKTKQYVSHALKNISV